MEPGNLGQLLQQSKPEPQLCSLGWLTRQWEVARYKEHLGN